MRNVQAKSLAYKGLVRPTLEYCSSVWDPYQNNLDYQPEIIQRRAARVAQHSQLSSNYRSDLSPVILTLSRHLTAQQMLTNSASSPPPTVFQWNNLPASISMVPSLDHPIIIILIIMAGMAVFYVAAYLIEERRADGL